MLVNQLLGYKLISLVCAERIKTENEKIKIRKIYLIAITLLVIA